MKNETIQHIYQPVTGEDWILVRTDRGIYSLRLGGFKWEKDTETQGNRTEIPFPYKNTEVEEIYTDQEWVYILLSGGGVIASGWTDVTLDGELSLGVMFTHISEYEPGLFQRPGFSALMTGKEGWSEKI